MRPRVAILLESSLEVSRRIMRGIVNYMERHEPWTIDFMPGALCEQHLPERWDGDGIIARIPSPSEAMRLARHSAPKVIFDPLDDYRAPEHPLSRWPRVECDHIRCGELAAEYFIGRGFTSFAYVDITPSSAPGVISDRSWPKVANWRMLRQNGFKHCLEQHGFSCHTYKPPTRKLEYNNANIERPRLVRFLLSLPKPVAIFCPNDARGRQVADACLFAGIRVPYQVAILGVNNDQTICGFSQPPLSSIPLDAETAGRKAAIALDALMHGRRHIENYSYKPLPIVTRATTLNFQTNDALVVSILEKIRNKHGFKLYATSIAAEYAMSLRHIEKRFQCAIGRSIGEVIRDTCLSNIMELVQKSDLAFKEIAAKAGHQSVPHLSEAFRKRFGMTMTQAREKSAQSPQGT